MRFRFSWTALAAVVAIALLPLKSGGCGGKTACIKADKGVCPSVDAAASFFSGRCGGPVSSVDGPAEFDGQLCCYPVTEYEDNFIVGCAEPGAGGFGAVGGFGGSFGGGGFGGGGFGGAPICFTCADQLFGASPGSSELCPEAAEMWEPLTICACSACNGDCTLSVCQGQGPDATCDLCLQSSCALEWNACAGN